MEKKPYTEVKDLEFQNAFIRTFNKDVVSEELVWHTDKEDRIVEVLHNGGNWRIQFDNMLPEVLNEKVFIKKGEFHRVIKGDGVLKVRVIKLK